MRPQQPDETLDLDRDGFAVQYDIYGDGSDTILLAPGPIQNDDRMWDAQIPHLARNHRVIVLLPRGRGRSPRSLEPADYGMEKVIGDMKAVLDATSTDSAIVIGVSMAGAYSLVFAAMHPDRVRALVAIAPTIPSSFDHEWGQAFLRMHEDHGITEGPLLWNVHAMQRDHRASVEVFARGAFSAPHSERLIEKSIDAATEIDVAQQVAFESRDPEAELPDVDALGKTYDGPLLFVHGSDDVICPLGWSQRLADAYGAPLVRIEGGDHGVCARRAPEVNRIIDDFLHRELGIGRPPSRSRRSSNQRVLMVSSPLGLGHARRDIAIATELRAIVPEVEIEWLAQEPVTKLLELRDEVVHPASSALRSEVEAFSAQAHDHHLHAYGTLRRMDAIMTANFMVFDDVVRGGDHDLVVADEAWEIDHWLHECPSAKRTNLAWLTDFVGMLPMPDDDERDVALTADHNQQMIGQVERHPLVRDRALFVGDPEDLVDVPFGPGLPSLKEWTEHHFDFTGYIAGANNTPKRSRAELRAELGVEDDETLCIVSVGGTGAGWGLLALAVEAHRHASAQEPSLRTVVVTGPLIDPASLPDAPGLSKLGFLPNLDEHLAQCDIALVQGGLATTMELTAAGVPFLYAPLLDHFEQQIHVRHRLERHRAGTAVDLQTATAESVADALLMQLGRDVDYLPVSTDGARRAAGRLAELLG